MQTAIYISLWAYMFTGPLSEPGQVFGWLKNWLYKTEKPYLNERRQMLYNALVGCAKCHAGQVALWYQVLQFSHGGGFDIPFILIAIAGAYALQTWHQIVEKYLNR